MDVRNAILKKVWNIKFLIYKNQKSVKKSETTRNNKEKWHERNIFVSNIYKIILILINNIGKVY